LGLRDEEFRPYLSKDEYKDLVEAAALAAGDVFSLALNRRTSHIMKEESPPTLPKTILAACGKALLQIGERAASVLARFESKGKVLPQQANGEPRSAEQRLLVAEPSARRKLIMRKDSAFPLGGGSTGAKIVVAAARAGSGNSDQAPSGNGSELEPAR
jgi:hypothetical protein